VAGAAGGLDLVTRGELLDADRLRDSQ
jgi:hypothetical protein